MSHLATAVNWRLKGICFTWPTLSHGIIRCEVAWYVSPANCSHMAIKGYMYHLVNTIPWHYKVWGRMICLTWPLQSHGDDKVTYSPSLLHIPVATLPSSFKTLFFTSLFSLAEPLTTNAEEDECSNFSLAKLSNNFVKWRATWTSQNTRITLSNT